MEVGTVPGQAPEGGIRGRALAPPKGASDWELVGLIRDGSAAAFEALDARYRGAILSFCRQLLCDPDEAEDAVQHTFLAAYTSILSADQELELRPWLYTIARNRCYSILRARREVAMPELEHGTSEEPGALVVRREELRDLVLDVSRLPEDQRAALVMAELGAHSHDEIAGALEVPRAKVKALVFQARASLMATRTAREADCADIRRQLRSVRGAALRRGTLRRHLHECPACREYRRQLRYQRTQFAAAVLPLGPLLAIKNLLGRAAVAGRTAPATGGAGTAVAAVKLGALKPVAGALAAMLSAASAVVAVHQIELPRHHARSARPPARAHALRGHARSTAASPRRHRVTRSLRARTRIVPSGQALTRAHAAPRLPGVFVRQHLDRAALADRWLSQRMSAAPGPRHPAPRATSTPPPAPPRVGGSPGVLPVASAPPTIPHLVHKPILPDPGITPPSPGAPGDPGPNGGPGDPGRKPLPVPPVHDKVPLTPIALPATPRPAPVTRTTAPVAKAPSTSSTMLAPTRLGVHARSPHAPSVAPARSATPPPLPVPVPAR